MKKASSPLNVIWLFMIVFATIIAGYTGQMAAVTAATFESAETAVELAIGLVGAMALWLGILKVIEAAGLMALIARWIRPLMVRLFPEVPADHPAMSAMLMNIAANGLGLGNAATPLGLKAMTELNKLNANPGTATNAMCLFLAINTSSVTLLPIEVIALRSSAGADNPGSIIIPTLVATLCSTAVAITMAKLLAARGTKLEAKSVPTVEHEPLDSAIENDLAASDSPTDEPADLSPPGTIGNVVFGGLALVLSAAILYKLVTSLTTAVNGVPYFLTTDFVSVASHWLLPTVICLFLLVSYFRGVKVYEVMTEGAKEGFEIAIRIIPFLVAILVAIGMFRASGALDLMATALLPVTSLIGLPPEALPMALIRPLSGGGAYGLMSDIVSNDPNSFLADLVSTMQGSTETTFYVLAVYFGSIGISRSRHAVPAALCADATGLLASLAVCRFLF
ncbi:Spore maturation protein A [Acaryochloris thomasi RCC1774]|uniref:Spore maturation protein A n=1 Tax=Acaryochloris thomasi RCC1774 TaxID=1764569 RepID=A0A2W1JMP1_9CYAN|nr:spore maturation protein [Acaryochloris thomasi]PZD74549.1 Spore maturation protein A [Acaryochloris thomasi RCC1774]